MGKHFYINGCSHSSGAELSGDNGSGLAYDESWTNQLARSLGAENIVNEAAPGNSNSHIIQRTIDYVTNNLNEDLFVIVGFTATDRMYIKHPAYEKNKPYQRAILTPGVIDDKRFQDENLLKEHHDMYKSLLLTDWGDWSQQQLRFLQEVNYLKTFLEDHAVPYFFVSTLFPVQKRYLRIPQYRWLNEKTMSLRTYCNMQPNGVYYKMLKDNFPISPKFHIGIEGQTHFANLIKGHIIKYDLLLSK